MFVPLCVSFDAQHGVGFGRWEVNEILSLCFRVLVVFSFMVVCGLEGGRLMECRGSAFWVLVVFIFVWVFFGSCLDFME